MAYEKQLLYILDRIAEALERIQKQMEDSKHEQADDQNHE